jgi:hypothetical protein
LTALDRVLAFFWGPADPRTYALVRRALALAGLVNLVDLWPHRYEYFASTGAIAMSAVRQARGSGLYLSLFDFVGSERGVTAVFAFAAASLVALGLGVATRASALGVFVWHLSYCHRAFPILHGWDHILRAYSLLVLVSPTGDTGNAGHGREAVPAYGLRLMQWQLFVLYTTTVWLKVPDAYWRNGQLLAYFEVSIFSRIPDTTLLVRHEWISAVGTYASLATEAAVPWLLWFKRTRLLGLGAGVALHFAIALTGRIAIFSTCMLVPYMAFLDGDDIDRLGRALRAAVGPWRRMTPTRPSR